MDEETVFVRAFCLELQHNALIADSPLGYGFIINIYIPTYGQLQVNNRYKTVAFITQVTVAQSLKCSASEDHSY